MRLLVQGEKQKSSLVNSNEHSKTRSPELTGTKSRCCCCCCSVPRDTWASTVCKENGTSDNLTKKYKKVLKIPRSRPIGALRQLPRNPGKRSQSQRGQFATQARSKLMYIEYALAMYKDLSPKSRMRIGDNFFPPLPLSTRYCLSR